ncbi:MAG: hypothetical protein JWR39_749 [Devosia sp.]|jgi:hypothetical protein|nr:hypothetical protein [Devosia sp.]
MRNILIALAIFVVLALAAVVVSSLNSAGPQRDVAQPETLEGGAEASP